MSEGTSVTMLVMAGGTGGHVIPALSVAEKLRERGVSIHWLGTRRGIESELVPAADIPLHFIEIEGVRGKSILSWLKLPWLLLHAVWQARQLITQIKPVVVLGLGGFASGPGGIAAWLMGKPLVIHEQNAVAGTTNRWLSRVARKCLQAFPGSLKGAELVGNPVRAQISALKGPRERFDEKFANKQSSRNLLVLGGSLGALKLNQLIPEAVAMMSSEQRPHIWHQCGKAHLSTTRTHYQEMNVVGKVEAFISDMAEAYEWADLVVCRSGALTVAEITAAGVAAIFVPFPYAIDDHQTKNAQWLVANDAGIIEQQNQLTPESLSQRLSELLSNPARLKTMAVNARELALPEAANRVADTCLELAG